MSWLPLPYIQLESARTNGADYFDTQWNAGYGFSVQFAGCAFTDGGYLFGAMTSEDSTDKFALQFQDGKYIYYFGDQTAESPATYELGEPHFFSLSGSSWSIDGVGMPTISFYLSPSNEMTLPVYVGAVNVDGEAQFLSDVQIGYINFNGSSGGWQWYQCKTQDGKFGFYCTTKFVEKPDFTYGEVMATQSGTILTLVGAPTKKDYKLGEPFDITGATVYLNLDDGTQRDITDEVSPNSRSYTYFNSNKIYRSGYVPYLYYRYNPVGVEYNNFQFGGGREYSVSLPQTLYYTVSTDSPVESIEVTKLPDKTEYLIKEYFSTYGMIVTGHLANGDAAEIGDSCTSSPSYFTKEGTIDVTISWYDGSKYLYADPFQITVKNGVEKLEVTFPTKSEYSIGEKFNPTGITVTALYLDGTERPIYNFFVDSSKFDSTKEGGYKITVKATVDEEEYTETITVYVFGEPKKLEDLLGTTDGMTVIRNNVKNDSGKDTVPGVDWFVFDGITAGNIYVSGDNFISFNNTTEHIKICRRDGATYYVYSQSGKLDNGRKFFKIRVEGYTYWSSTDAQYALKYELFLFDDNSMFLNILQAPTNTSYLGTSELLYGTTHAPFTVESGKAQVFSFYTTDTAQGKPWTVKAEYHEFLKSVMVDYIAATPTKREYDLGDSFDATAFTVTATHLDGSTETISDFTATSETFDSQKEGRYPVTVTAQINGQEYTAETLVAVYGEPYDILDLLNTKDGMNTANWPSLDASKFGDVSWFTYDGKPVEQIGIRSRREIYFNTQKVLSICTASSVASNNAFIQEGILVNGHKFLKLRCEWTSTNVSFPTFEFFLFDDNSMYLNLIRPASAEGTTTATQLTWSDGQIEVPVTADEFQKFSFYTDNPSKGKPWAMETDYHNFIKEKMRTLTVKGGEGSGLYLPGEKVTIHAEEKSGNHFRWVKDRELFALSPKVTAKYSGYSPTGFTNGNFIVFAFWSYAEADSAMQENGWVYDGTLTESGDKDAGNTKNTGHVHIYHKINDGNLSVNNHSGLFFEIINTNSIELQESTRQENLLLTSANSFLCEKGTDDLYLWFLFALYWSTGRRWVAQPDVVSYFPSVGNSDSNFSVLTDENVPPVSFRARVSSSMDTRYGSAIGARIVPSCTGYEYEMTFAMPGEDLTLTANYSPKLGRIEITEQPFKLNYALNERFDRSGMVVTAYYADGTSATVTDYTVSDLDSSTVGVKELTVTYTDGIDTATATLTVNVGISGITITKRPDKTAYKLNEPFDPTGLEVSFVYADNSTHPTEDYTLSRFENFFVGIKTITASCVVNGETYNAQFSVTVTKLGDNPFSGYNENRTLRIHFTSGKYEDITGDEIEGESMSLTESLGNDKNLRFGGCISTQFSVNIFSEQFLNPDVFPEGDIEAYLETPEDSLKIFAGTIDSAERTGGISKRKVIAYDCLKRKGTVKLRAWYNSLTFPIKQKQFRDSLFEYVGIEQIETTLKYDYAYVPDNMNVDSLTFLSLIKDICLCNMVFGHVDAEGRFEYIALARNAIMEDGDESTIYYVDPEDAIPDENVISATFKEGKIWFPAEYWISPNPDYSKDSAEPSGVEAYEGNIYFVRNSYMVGDSDWIKKSYLVRTKTYDDIIEEDYYLRYPIVMGPTANIDNLSFLYLAREYSLTTPGNFLRRIGTNIAFNCIKYLEDGTPVTWTINSYIMSRTITGVRSLKDVYTAKNSAYNEEAYGAAKDIRDNTDSMNTIKNQMPKSTVLDDDGNPLDEKFNGVDSSKQAEFDKYMAEEEKRMKEEYEKWIKEKEKEWDKEQKDQEEREKEEKKKYDQMLADAKEDARKRVKENPNTLYVYDDGTARYNGVTIGGSSSSGGGGGGGGTGGGFDVQSVTSLPSNPDPNTIYLIQGEVVVE